jgi:SPP1 family predicted phage head-tail adaptor
MQAGKLKYKMNLLEPRRKSDSYNDPAASGWNVARGIYVALRPLKGNERYVADRTQHETTHRIDTRYANDITPENMLEYFDALKGTYRYFQISEVIDPEEIGATLKITATEIYGFKR